MTLEGITLVETMEQAVEAAARLVQAGDVVLLSPGGTSFDAFRDFAERGNRFKDLVRDL
jgi:UDP-N-acetylmuramoylalanine--D-glutamate ligase